ncbi:MAG: hypothetical protein A2945_04950 [Candidatus Liptonbacteria bacterium RIFCSPLOWO2_01_FULL_52_25]|uniref:Uncharacterized protein n=1 Tax=Candidatus Liptonbacteria bacterium RIFCSPLOWO2_01_FULL_52_25 TaxID=1798650 RepID=A0A1G2CEX3_9BACT|nr:MAG: hypothetical protein A2945_04950 [Candidatus Liptonbacteria bacterium RIFCSPLOWO2_01_FULL_52_25]
MSKKVELIIIVVAVAVVATLFGYWYFVMRVPTSSPPAPEPTIAPLAAPASLGETIYEQAQNPVADKMPEVESPAVNPIEGAYKNPFE